jgi:hypothetical protein
MGMVVIMIPSQRFLGMEALIGTPADARRAMPAKLDERPHHMVTDGKFPDFRADCNDDTGKLVTKHCWKRYAEILLGEMQVGVTEA